VATRTATRVRQPARSKASAKLSGGHPAILLTVASGVLVVVGLVMILSASSVQSFATTGSSFMYFQRQLVWAAIGVVAFIAFVRLDYRVLRKVSYVFLPLCVVMLVAVMIPGIGITVGGSARWIGLGPLAFQPSEAAKLAMILFVAEVYTRKKEHSFEEFSHTALPFLPALGVVVMLVMAQPDLGTTMLISFISLGMLFVAGAPLRYILPIGSIGAVLAVGAALAAPYRRARVLAFLDPWADPLNTGYHTIQSLIAVGSGGWFGVGLGASRQKWMYVPNAHTDFIFAILGEEMGLLGTLTIVGVFAFIGYLGIKVAQRAPDRFGMLVASGITIWITVQALVNMGAVTGSLPVTGVPLPLVSFGGTSLVICLAAMGILVNIASQGRFSVGTKRGAPKR
jgi:cell division protein FtsW